MMEIENGTGNKSKLFAKIAAVMTEVRKLKKDGNNQFDKYKYITGDSAFERLGGEMAAVGLVMIPSVVEVDTKEVTSKSGGIMYFTTVQGQITLADCETGETWTSVWFGEGSDRGDKSINKAMTAMMKYFLLRVFQIGSGEDADADSPDLTKEPAQKPAQATQPQLATAPTPAHRQPVTNGTPSGDAPKSAAFKKFMAEGTTLFSGEWDNARHWIIEMYTQKNTPDNKRASANDLTDAELNTLAGTMKTNANWFKTEWKKQPAKEAA